MSSPERPPHRRSGDVWPSCVDQIAGSQPPQRARVHPLAIAQERSVCLILPPSANFPSANPCRTNVEWHTRP